MFKRAKSSPEEHVGTNHKPIHKEIKYTTTRARQFIRILGSLTLPRLCSKHTHMPGSDTDEFAAYDFSEFTEADFVQIDAEISSKHLPKVTIAYETPDGAGLSSYRVSPRKRPGSRESPLDSFRPHGTLSVTDIASPAWCEVQFEYGLRGKRSRPLYQRPKSFKSASGKEISTDAAIAAQNDVITSKGKVIHKALEREVKGEEVAVRITTPEERWALRQVHEFPVSLVNMLACLRGMQLEGITREMPVFGIEDGEIIVGIMDELVYQPIVREKRDDQQAGDPSRTRIEHYFPVPGSSADCKVAPKELTSYGLQIIDTKTRKHASLPLIEDTLSSQLQLMLYCRLLSRLVSSEISFDFITFWQLANVDSVRPLSWHFLEQAGLIADHGEFQVLSLADLSVLWQDLVHQMRITEVDDQLKLIYRLQSYDHHVGTSPDAPGDPPTNTIVSSLGMSDNCTVNNEVVSPPGPGAHSRSINLHSVQGGGVKQKRHTQELGDAARVHYQTLGTKIFKYDSDLLSAHVTDILSWWRGGRKPRGVPVELARRCRNCEYHDNCEWREERAKEFREQGELKRGSSPVDK